MRLRDLDDRLVPRMAVSLRNAIDRLPGRRSAASLEHVPPPVPVPSRPPVDAGFDDDPDAERGGLLGLIRDVPQLAALVIAAVFLAAGAFVLQRSGEDRAEQAGQTASQEQEPDAPSSVLGPEPGTDVDDYLARTRADTTALAARDGSGRYIGLVLLSDYVTPTALEATVQGFGIGQVTLRAPSAGDLAEVIVVPTPGDPRAVLRAVYERTAADKREQEAEFRGLAESIEGTGPQEQEERAAYEVDARRVAAEAAAYASDCACVFAVVVEGTATALAGLLDAPGVRSVEAAGRGSELDALEITPLWPEQTGTVPTDPTAP